MKDAHEDEDYDGCACETTEKGDVNEAICAENDSVDTCVYNANCLWGSHDYTVCKKE